VVLKEDGDICWTERVRNEVLQRVKKKRNIVHTRKRRNVNWTGQSCVWTALQSTLLKEI